MHCCTLALLFGAELKLFINARRQQPSLKAAPQVHARTCTLFRQRFAHEPKPSQHKMHFFFPFAASIRFDVAVRSVERMRNHATSWLIRGPRAALIISDMNGRLHTRGLSLRKQRTEDHANHSLVRGCTNYSRHGLCTSACNLSGTVAQLMEQEPDRAICRAGRRTKRTAPVLTLANLCANAAVLRHSERKKPAANLENSNSSLATDDCSFTYPPLRRSKIYAPANDRFRAPLQKLSGAF